MELENLLHHRLATEIEFALGNPNDVNALMSYKRVMELDEQQAFQEEFFQFLLSLKLHHHYVPAELGGKLESYQQLYALGKVLARRDLSTAVTMSTMIWSTLVWVGGNPELKKRCADLTMSIHGAQCLAYSEEDHGSDLLSNRLTATEVEDGYVLNGEKWPINRASRSDVVMLLARTSNNDGARNLSLFMIEKNKIDCSAFNYLPKINTHGLRGCDISGIKFTGAKIPKSALIGNVGDGLELAIKAFQITRTLCAALSIGALENNLRVVMDFAINRRLYKGNVFDIPNAKHYLTGAFTDLLVTDAMGSALSRALHVIPKQFSVLSAVAKCFVPYQLDRSQKNMATVLGARFFFRSKHREGIFQKTLRDSQVVSLFDGSSEVNLYSLTTQLAMLAKRQEKIFNREKSAANTTDKLNLIFNATADLAAFNGEKLDLSSHGKDMIMESWPVVIEQLTELADELPIVNDILPLAQSLYQKHQQNLARILAKDERKLEQQSPKMFDLARQYGVVHAGICSLNYWLHNRHQSDQFVASGHWLVTGLQRLLLDVLIEVDISEEHIKNVSEELYQRTTQAKSYGLVSLALPDNTLIKGEEVA